LCIFIGTPAPLPFNNFRLIFVGNFAALPGTIARRALLTLLAQRAAEHSPDGHRQFHRGTCRRHFWTRDGWCTDDGVDPSTVFLVEALMYFLSGLIVGI